MSEHLIRLKRLLDLARSHSWTDAELARRLQRSQQQVRSWQDGTRSIGERLARAIEEQLGLPRFYLDERHTPSVTGQGSERGSNALGLPVLAEVATRTPSDVPICPWDLLGGLQSMNDADRALLPTLATFCSSSGRSFFVEVRDTALTPRAQVGDHVLIDPAITPNAGDIVLICAGDADFLLRVYTPRTSTAWVATSLNAAFAPLEHSADALRIVGTAVELRSYLRKA